MFSFKNHPTLWFFARLLWKLGVLRKINHKVEVPHFMIFLLAIVQTGIFVENNIIKWQLRKCPNLWSAVKPLQKLRRRRNTYIINWDWRKNRFLSCVWRWPQKSTQSSPDISIWTIFGFGYRSQRPLYQQPQFVFKGDVPLIIKWKTPFNVPGRAMGRPKSH